MRGRVLLIGVAVVAVGVAGYRALVGEEPPPSGSDRAVAATAAAEEAVAVSLAYSPEQRTLLAPLIERFNREGQVVGGRPIAVIGTAVDPGEAASRLADGRLKVTAWSPTSSLWGRLVNFEADQRLVADENPSLVRTPVVIAMWEPMARALGWPRKELGFGEFLAVAASPAGWAQVGKPAYGRFKLGHTSPEFSTSGLAGVAALYYAAAGKREGLLEQDVGHPKVRARVRAIEQSIVHYGDTTRFFVEQMQAHGPGYVSATAMEETTLLEFNRTRPRGVPRLVALYPREGTFVADNPFVVLDAAWVTPLQRRAAQKLGAWLRQEITPVLAARHGFRPGETDVPPRAPIDRAHGVDPGQPARALSLPEPRVLAAIKRAWHEDRKPANVLLVVDVSGSMNERQRLVNAKDGLRTFLARVAPRDQVGLVTFNEHITVVAELAPAPLRRLGPVVGGLFASGATALYDATLLSLELMANRLDPTRINAIVILSDGADSHSRATLADVVGALERSSERLEGAIRVFTIAYDADENAAVLRELATVSGGKAYEGTPREIEAVYRQISSFF